MFCASQASTAICSSNMDQIQPSSSNSSSSSTINQLGGRAIDRHNPIIREGRRFTRSALPLTSPCTSLQQPPPINPTPYHQLQKKTKKTSASDNNKNKNKDHQSKKKSSAAKANTKPSDHQNKKKSSSSSSKPEIEHNTIARKSFAKPSDFITGTVVPPPLAAGSSRYLLSDTSLLDGLSDIDPVLALVPADPKKTENHHMGLNQDESIASKTKPSSSSSSENPSSNQVVVLRVSLHCKGCEGKVRKHLSRMQGVTSFNIDYAAKKVTVTGDVTPLDVLASISKVKSAQFWTSSSSNPTIKK